MEVKGWQSQSCRIHEGLRKRKKQCCSQLDLELSCTHGRSVPVFIIPAHKSSFETDILLIGLATYYDSDHEDGDDIVSPSKKLNVS
jgi:hypothetical protein